MNILRMFGNTVKTSIKTNESNITINGKTFSGSGVIISNGAIMVDGAEVEKFKDKDEIVIEGDIESITTDKSLQVNGIVKGDANVKGNLNCGSIEGSVESHGVVNCDNIGGNLIAKGVVNCNRVIGRVFE